MKKEIAETKLRRDLRVSLYSFLLYLAGMAAGFSVPRLGLFLYAGIPASYAPKLRFMPISFLRPQTNIEWPYSCCVKPVLRWCAPGGAAKGRHNRIFLWTIKFL